MARNISKTGKTAPETVNEGGAAPLTDAIAVEALSGGGLSDPFAVLGPHRIGERTVVRAFLPGAESVELVSRDDGASLGRLEREGDSDLWTGARTDDVPYLLRIQWPDAVQETEDPYSFGPILGDLDLHLFSEGSHWDLAQKLGSAEAVCEGVAGVRFAVWAPNARRVSVVGDFNMWDGRRHPMRRRGESGVWELFLPRLTAGATYKYEIVGPHGHVLPQKADPLARQTELPPATASVVASPDAFAWTDQRWMAERAGRQSATSPISIYEVHAASWLRPEGNDSTLDWQGLSDRLIPYAVRLGFTHVELLPIMEHPFGGSWGYQPLSQFAPSARYGSPAEFAGFVDACHAAGLGVILDWVPAHFPTDVHGMAEFDGTHLYEHADPREGFHQDWNTLIFNLGRREVSGYLLASALYWLETFHIDGLRVDAVASMLYRDYSREHDQWVPNIHGGRENLESIAFLKRLNTLVKERAPGAITLAEESTAWPGVSRPVEQGGLGFDFKWNMGWMHDTLTYLGQDPIYRSYNHHDMTFGLVYAFSEHFVLPLSHDEVVHGKGSLYERAPGDPWRKLANLRAYYSFMWTHPGKKLMFMGLEIGQQREWNHDAQIDWDLLEQPGHAGLQQLVADLNRLYRNEPALHRTDSDPAGFDWLIGDAAADSVFAWVRRTEGAPPLMIVLNMTPVVREGYRVGAPAEGRWAEILNTDSSLYGGGDIGNAGEAWTRPEPAHGRPCSIEVTLPPLAALVFRLES
ncbi:MAG: 1,4-alpha-glucan branching protein GlgB [Alphaproteobacteria bacterium]|nr:1,4-alpha-glucan branching protein GlgB [Alphaproteobacteria bacterium]MBU2271074.1 1,4-alpha-glucan branching protein GlgB [Alphaproteobacteria bacterium]MBU2417602.1 1,4-alpha-glucan branching protein GlgB [Alphaproteobacteria bacterium]